MARRRLVAWSVLVTIAGFATHHAIAAQGFTEIFSGLFGPYGTTTNVKFVNDNGAVAGTAIFPDSTDVHSFVWTLTDGFIDIGTLGGPSATVVDLNNNRVAIGNSAAAAGGPSRAFIWTREDGIADLGTAGGSFAVAADVNDNNWVVGHSASANDVGERAFLWTPRDGLTDLCQQFGCYLASAKNGATHVNNNGQVVGYAYPFEGNTFVTQATLWDTQNGTLTAIFNDDPILKSADSIADIITDSGWIAGRLTSILPGEESPSFAPDWRRERGLFVWSFLRSPSGELFYPGHVTDLNENGWAVGWSSVAGEAHGFLWNPETETTVDIGEVEADFAPLPPERWHRRGPRLR